MEKSIWFVFIKNTYGRTTKYKRMLWIRLPNPTNFVMSIQIAHWTMFPAISKIEVTAVICAFTLIFLILSAFLDLDKPSEAIAFEAGSIFLKLKTFYSMLYSCLHTFKNDWRLCINENSRFDEGKYSMIKEGFQYIQ